VVAPPAEAGAPHSITSRDEQRIRRCQADGVDEIAPLVDPEIWLGDQSAEPLSAPLKKRQGYFMQATRITAELAQQKKSPVRRGRREATIFRPRQCGLRQG
jgi:hypothetical protein